MKTTTNANTTIGMEIEFNLIDRQGYIANEADTILDDHRSPGNFFAEAALSQIEVKSAPASTIHELGEDLTSKLLLLEDICNDYGVLPVPVSEFGAGKSKARAGNLRYDIYDKILGVENNQKVNTLSGTHIHISQVPSRNYDQYCLFHGLDPLSYALTSTSPIRYDGLNSINCHRVNLIRQDVFENFPLHAHLLDYPHSSKSINLLNEKRYEQWKRASGLSNAEFSELFIPENTGFSPIRKRDSIGPVGTWEIRSLDTTTLTHALAAAAIYKGCIDHMLAGNIPLSIGRQEETYSFGPDEIVLPSFPTLKRLESLSIRHGTRSHDVASYLHHTIAFALIGLPSGDKPYLSPIHQKRPHNPAHHIIKHLHEQGHTGKIFSSHEAAKANLFMRGYYLHNSSLAGSNTRR